MKLLLKIASRSAALSFLAIALIFSLSIFSPKAQAGHIAAFPKNIAQIKNHLKTQNQLRFKTPVFSRNKIALKAIQKALTQVSDGAAYQWQHKKSSLSGRIKPTTTYRNASGQLCRHIQFSLYAGTVKKKSQALACRNNQGQWIVKS